VPAASGPGQPGPVLGPGHGGASIADVAERVTPSIVSVSSTTGEAGGESAGRGHGQGLGSGVVIQPGVIVTNNHVIEGADEIKVISYDGREFVAELVGTDPKSDLAVLRIQGDASALRPVAIGDSGRLRLGDIVLAIGNPFGVGHTVTMGIVSAKGRADVGIIDYEDFIQTDAAINPGNSGGALVDMEGKLIGINTAILSRSGGYQGIGFAIPTNMARPIIDSLLRYGKVVRGWLGVSIQDVDPDLARTLGLPRPMGVLISDVGPNTPAAKAGLRRGDVVLTINGQEVDSARQLRNLVATAGASSTVTMEILRRGARESVQVALGQLPESDAGPAWGAGGAAIVEGLMVEPITPANRSRYSIAARVTQGAVVIGVESGSPARAAGVEPGDVVIEINRTPVLDVATFTQLWSRASGRTAVALHRSGKTIRVIVNK